MNADQLKSYFRKHLPEGTSFTVEEVALFSGIQTYGKVTWEGGECEKKAQEWIALDIKGWANDNLPKDSTRQPSAHAGIQEMDSYIRMTGQEVSVAGPLDLQSIELGFLEIEQHNFKVDAVLVGPGMYQQFPKSLISSKTPPRGASIKLYGAMVHVLPWVPENRCYFLSGTSKDLQYNPKKCSRIVWTP